MDETLPTAVDPSTLRARRYLLKRDFKVAERSFARRFFEPIPFPTEAAQRLARLYKDGEVVHVMRSVGVLNFLYLAWALLYNGLPPLRAAIGLAFSFWSPFRKLLRKGTVAERLTGALDRGNTALVFLREPTGLIPWGRPAEDPFLALIGRARKAVRPLYLVPDLFLWRARPRNLKPTIRDLVFGNPEAPGRLMTAVGFLLFFKNAFFRVGEPIDLTKFVREHASDSDEVLVRKVRGSLSQFLARETRAIVGPPLKDPDRIIEETLRDRTLKAALDQAAAELSISPEHARRKAKKNLEHIANRYVPLLTWSFKNIVTFTLSRLYQAVDADDADIERMLSLKAKAPLVYVPSHKSHLDYLLMGWFFADRGIVPPTVAAGANLSFWPLGWYLRHTSAFFLRRSFKGDPIYGATFKAYIKKLVREGQSQEFFIEGTRSRTGKLMQPKTGMLSFEVDAVLEGAQDDLYFVPVAIDYDKLIEARSYTKELAGGEKQPESVKSLLAAPKIVLTKAKSGWIYLRFGEPVSLKAFLAERVRDPSAMTEEQKRSAIAALAQRITWGIGRVTTITPVSLVCAALLSHRRRGISARDAGARIHFLRECARKESLNVSPVLTGAPSDPSTLGPINEVVRRLLEDNHVKAQVVGGDTIYTVPDERRPALALYKNNLVHLFAKRSFTAAALLSFGGEAPEEKVRERFLYLLKLFKHEFSYRSGLSDAEPLYREAREALIAEGLIEREGDRLRVTLAPHARDDLAFLRDLTRDLMESYRVVFAALPKAAEPIDRKAFVAQALEQGRRDFLAGGLTCSESLSRPVCENAIEVLKDGGWLVEKDKKLALAVEKKEPGQVPALLAALDEVLASGGREA
ncbi:MAG: 1-acyl-sn-glycerol-3-phosphate acyltransferase [Myxococcales bacterium]